MDINEIEKKDILLPVGTIILARQKDETEAEKYMIIGKRCFNPESGNVWDYITVPFPKGFYRIKGKQYFKEDNENGYFSNYFYLNHYDIDGIVKRKEPAIKQAIIDEIEYMIRDGYIENCFEKTWEVNQDKIVEELVGKINFHELILDTFQKFLSGDAS